MGIGLMLLAVAVPIVALFVLVLPQFRLDPQVVPADGAPHALTVTRGAEYAVYAETRDKAAAPACVIVDAPSGRPIVPRYDDRSVTIGNRMIIWRFDTGGGLLSVTCRPAAGLDEVAIGTVPNTSLLLLGTIGSLGFALVVGGIGVTMLIVTVARRK